MHRCPSSLGSLLPTLATQCILQLPLTEADSNIQRQHTTYNTVTVMMTPILYPHLGSREYYVNVTSGIPYKLTVPDVISLACSHIAVVLDTGWSPHDDIFQVVASPGVVDGKAMIWDIEVEGSAFNGWGHEGWAGFKTSIPSYASMLHREISGLIFVPGADSDLNGMPYL